MKCKYCNKPDALFWWGQYRFCQSCNTRIFTIWEAAYLKRKYPGIEVYAFSKELDEIVDIEREKKKLLEYWL